MLPLVGRCFLCSGCGACGGGEGDGFGTLCQGTIYIHCGYLQKPLIEGMGPRSYLRRTVDSLLRGFLTLYVHSPYQYGLFFKRPQWKALLLGISEQYSPLRCLELGSEFP